MAKKIVTITILVNTDNYKNENWAKPDDYFEHEVDEVIDEIFTLANKPIKPIEKAKTESGTVYSLSIKSVNR